MAKPLAYTAGTLLILNNILGLTLPEFAVNYAVDAQKAANLIKS
jgi:dihydroxyacid dehydratase/phosphogluconate dehydratase